MKKMIPITREFLAFAKGDERDIVLNTILHEMNTYKKELYERYIRGVIDCGNSDILLGSIKDMYHEVPYTQRTYQLI